MPGGVLTASEKIEFGRRLVLTGKVGCWMRRKSRGHRREQQNKKWAFPDPLSITSSPSHQIRVLSPIVTKSSGRVSVSCWREGETSKSLVRPTMRRACSPNRDEPSRMWLLESGLSVGSEFNIYKTLFNVLPSVRIISLMRDDDTEAFRNAAMVADLWNL